VLGYNQTKSRVEPSSVDIHRPLPTQHDSLDDFAKCDQLHLNWKTICSVWTLRNGTRVPAEFRQTRKPLLLLRFDGLFLLRFADRQFSAVLFQLPPRFTRFEPLRIVHRSPL